uniref:JmjC domain-containing protein n=1 Tax=Mucochytrium quahogii TaxID=96639 RepID=A0A7S2RL38_9STRA|mmetsp:Transcript_16539/g.28674  ORF Transcript_16539/g.28674 Transcript_16539/m.28674 type:complete len:278 (+) Transcript_16539:90-923(+)
MIVRELDATCASCDTFYRDFVDRQIPVVLRNVGKDWPATKKWNFDYIAQIGGDISVMASVSNEEQNGQTVKTKASLAKLLNVYKNGIGDNQNNSIPYVKQFDLFGMFPQLRDDINLDIWNWRTHCCVNAWLGPAGAVTGVHSDDENNIAVSILGRKEFTIFAPEDRPYLYVNDKYDPGTECCSVDHVNPALELHPLYSSADPAVVVLNPGDGLFIPLNWWHGVRNLDASISINAFASTPLETVRYGSFRLLYWVLHNLGLYKYGNCVCHASRFIEYS